jgi:hypothetical protein
MLTKGASGEYGRRRSFSMTRFDSDTLLPDEEQQANDGDVAVRSCSLDEELVLDRLPCGHVELESWRGLT